MPEYLHLDFRPPTAWWVARLQGAALGSDVPEIRARAQAWNSSGLGELALALSTKWAIRYRSASLLNTHLQRLYTDLAESGKLEELLEGGYVFTPSDPALLFDICLAVDSFYFESRSAYEITGAFIKRFCEVILKRDVDETGILDQLRDAGEDLSWISGLRENRKLFFHHTAPWLALSITQRDPLEFKLVVMKENLDEFDDAEKFILQDEFDAAWRGYEHSMRILRDWLEGQCQATPTETDA